MGTAEFLRKRDPVVTVQTHLVDRPEADPKIGKPPKENAALGHFLHAVDRMSSRLEEADIVPNGARGFKSPATIRPAAARAWCGRRDPITTLLAQRPLIMTKFRHWIDGNGVGC
jgi:hypothetical protein